MPFTDAKKKNNDNYQLNIMIDGSICHDQSKIANYFCYYFTNIAHGITNTDSTTNDSFATHAIVQSIINNSTGTDNFQFQRVSRVKVETTLQVTGMASWQWP